MGAVTAKKNSSASRKGIKNNIVPFNLRRQPSLFLAIFKDIVTLKNAALELKKLNIKLRSISIGKPEVAELEKLSLPTDRVYAFFMPETVNSRIENACETIVNKYQGFVLDKRLVIN